MGSLNLSHISVTSERFTITEMSYHENCSRGARHPNYGSMQVIFTLWAMKLKLSPNSSGKKFKLKVSQIRRRRTYKAKLYPYWEDEMTLSLWEMVLLDKKSSSWWKEGKWQAERFSVVKTIISAWWVSLSCVVWFRIDHPSGVSPPTHPPSRRTNCHRK